MRQFLEFVFGVAGLWALGLLIALTGYGFIYSWYLVFVFLGLVGG